MSNRLAGAPDCRSDLVVTVRPACGRLFRHATPPEAAVGPSQRREDIRRDNGGRSHD